MEKERAIKVSDFVLQFLRKWRRILIWMIIVALLLNGYAGAKSYKAVVSSKKETSLKENGVSESLSGLDDQDKKKVEDAFELYSSYQNTYDNSLDYYKNSIKMQINSNCVPKELMQYRIEPSENVASVITDFSRLLQSQDICEKINENLDEEQNVSFLSELITVEGKREDEDIDKIVVNKEDFTNVMLVQVIAPDKTMCKTIADILEKEIEIKSNDLKNDMGDFNITYIGRDYSENADTNLLIQQQEYLQKLRQTKESMDDIKENLTDDQKDGLDELLKQQDINSGNITEIQEPVSVDYVNIKYILLGLFMGLVLSCCWYFMLYYLDRRLLTTDELEKYCKLHILDTFTLDSRGSKKKCIIDCLINKMFHVEEDTDKEKKMKMIGTNIQILARKKNMNNIHIMGVASSPEAENMRQDIMFQIHEEGCIISVGGSVITDSESLKRLSDSDGVILVERVRDSILKNIEKEIEICKNQGTPILGVVVIQ